MYFPTQLWKSQIIDNQHPQSRNKSKLKSLKTILARNNLNFHQKCHLLIKILNWAIKQLSKNGRTLRLSIHSIFFNSKNACVVQADRIDSKQQITRMQGKDKVFKRQIIEAEYVKQFGQVLYYVLTGNEINIKSHNNQINTPQLEVLQRNLAELGIRQSQQICELFNQIFKQNPHQRIKLSSLLGRIDSLMYKNKQQPTVFEVNSVIGRLEQIQNKNEYPYNCIGLIKGKKSSASYLGTGCLISANIILTAAHNIASFKTSQHGFLTFQLSADENSKKYEVQSFRLSRFYNIQSTDDISQTNMQNDFALMKLRQQIILPRYLPLAVEQKSAKEITMFGFISNHKNKQFFVGAMGSILHQKQESMTYSMDTESGMSGSPILIQDSKLNYYNVGIHSGFKLFKKQVQKEGLKFTKNKINEINIMQNQMRVNAKLINQPHEKIKSLQRQVYQNIDKDSRVEKTRERVHSTFKNIKYYKKLDQFVQTMIQFIKLQEMLRHNTYELAFVRYKKGNSFAKYGYLGLAFRQYTRAIDMLVDLGSDQSEIEVIQKSKLKLTRKINQLNQQQQTAYFSQITQNETNKGFKKKKQHYQTSLGCQGLQNNYKPGIGFRMVQKQINRFELIRQNQKQAPCLDIGNQSIGPEDCRGMTAFQWQHLLVLKMSHNYIGPEGFQFLTKANMNNIRQLDLHDNHIGAEGCRHFKKAQWNQLQILDISNNYIGKYGFEYLARIQQSNIQQLNISRNYMEVQGCQYFLSIQWKQLKIVNLSENHIGDAGCQYFKICRLNLEKISLSYNYIGDKGCEWLSKYLQKNLKILKLDNNYIEEQGKRYLTEVQWPHLISVDLRNNSTGLGILQITDKSSNKTTLCQGNHIEQTSNIADQYGIFDRMCKLCCRIKYNYCGPRQKECYSEANFSP